MLTLFLNANANDVHANDKDRVWEMAQRQLQFIFAPTVSFQEPISSHRLITDPTKQLKSEQSTSKPRKTTTMTYIIHSISPVNAMAPKEAPKPDPKPDPKQPSPKGAQIPHIPGID